MLSPITKLPTSAANPNQNLRLIRKALCAVLLLGCANAPPLQTVAFAQISGRGTLQGTVTDPSGAIVRGAEVKAVEVRTNTDFNQTTTGAGFYSFGGLQPGSYTVTVTAAGFQTFVQQNIALDALQTTVSTLSSRQPPSRTFPANHTKLGCRVAMVAVIGS